MRFNNLKNLVIIALALFLFNGCASHTGMTTSSASIESSDFVYVKKSASESVTATTILFIGGLGKKAMVAQARSEIMEYVRDGEVLANVTVDYKNTYFIIGWTQKVTVTADIIRFVDTK